MIEKEKAEAYDKAIERAKKLYGNGIAEEIFPELKEDDDEKIKKDLIQWVDEFPDTIWRGHYKNNIIAWLEKQGDKDKLIQELGEYKVKYTQEVLEKHITSMSNKDDERLRKNTIAFLKDFADLGYENAVECIDWLEKQGDKSLPQTNERAWLYLVSDVLTWKDGIGQYLDDPRVQELAKRLCSEYAQKLYNSSILSNSSNTGKNEQKSADKIEPKFKIGDWVVNKFGDSWHINSFDKKNYQVSDGKGNYNYFPISKQDEMHLWTIQDVRDGDVIFYDEGWICIFKCIHGIWYSSYCFITDDGEFHTGYERHAVDSTIHGNAHPATKEQRDALMKAINDAGYEWDSEKKELKKLDLVPNKKPILGGLNMKTYNDVNIGDTVYIWGSGDSSVDETTITEKHDDRGHWNLKFSNGCVGRALKNGTSSTMGMYACLVYSDKEAVRESINERIKILSNIKI